MMILSLIALEDFLSFSRRTLSWAAYGNGHIFKLIKQLGHLLPVGWEAMTYSPWKYPIHVIWGKTSSSSGTNSNPREARNNIGSFYSNQENSLLRLRTPPTHTQTLFNQVSEGNFWMSTGSRKRDNFAFLTAQVFIRFSTTQSKE